MAVNVAGKQFCVEQDTEIIVRKKAILGTEYEVTDVRGNVLLRMGGPWFCLFGKTRWIQDCNGNTIFSMQKKPCPLSVLGTWTAKSNQQQQQHHDSSHILFRARKSSFLQFCKTSLDVLLGNDESPSLKVKSSWNDRTAKILHHGRIIAQMKRKTSLKSLLLNTFEAGITVSAGTDYALVSALVLILHELHSGRRRSSGSGT